MDKRVLLKIFCIVILSVMLVVNAVVVVEAATADDYLGVFSGDEGTNSGEVEGQEEIKKYLNRVIGVIQVIGVFIAVTMLISLGVKYMYASPGDKAQIKNHLTVYVVGACVMFGAAGILQILKDFFLDATA